MRKLINKSFYTAMSPISINTDSMMSVYSGFFQYIFGKKLTFMKCLFLFKIMLIYITGNKTFFFFFN